MALVQMKCPNCNGQMVLKNNQFCCPHCKTMVLNIIDAKINADIDIISPEEFAKKIQESKRQFIVNINDKLEVFDVETEVINKRVADATQMLEEGKFGGVIEHLASIKKDVLSVERLRYLAFYDAKNEYELSSHDGYVDGRNYNKLLSLCDAQTKATYQKIEAFCRTNYDQRNIIKQEAAQVCELIEVNLYDKALAYAQSVVKKYPNSAVAWSYLLTAKFYENLGHSGYANFEHELDAAIEHIKAMHGCEREYKMAKLCPDFYITGNFPSTEYDEQVPDAFYTNIYEYYKTKNRSGGDDGLSFEYHYYMYYELLNKEKINREEQIYRANMYRMETEIENIKKSIKFRAFMVFVNVLLFVGITLIRPLIDETNNDGFTKIDLSLLVFIFSMVLNYLIITKKGIGKLHVSMRDAEFKECKSHALYSFLLVLYSFLLVLWALAWLGTVVAFFAQMVSCMAQALH